MDIHIYGKPENRPIAALLHQNNQFNSNIEAHSSNMAGRIFTNFIIKVCRKV